MAGPSAAQAERAHNADALAAAHAKLAAVRALADGWGVPGDYRDEYADAAAALLAILDGPTP